MSQMFSTKYTQQGKRHVTQFDSWCDPVVLVAVNGHDSGVLVSKDDDDGISAVAATLAEKYTNTNTLATIAQSLGKPGVAMFLQNLFPGDAGSRSGDMGEILATSYLEEELEYTVGPSRLEHRDHPTWAMRGDDVLGARIDSTSGLQLAKGEAKSGTRIYEKTVIEAREGLMRESGLPSEHSLTQFAARLIAAGSPALGIAVMEQQLKSGIRPDMVLHLMFLFTQNDPTKHMTTDLTNYSGPIKQLALNLRVTGHQRFISTAYEQAPSYAP